MTKMELVQFANINHRAKKDGSKNAHKALATAHFEELLETSRYEKNTDEHSHQCLDENGWEIRKAYIQDIKGNIYEARLNIADGRDRKMLLA